MDEEKKMTTKLYEHSYKLVENSLELFETYELETLCFNIEVELRRRRFKSQDVNLRTTLDYPYDWAESIEITYPQDLTQTDEDDLK